MDKFKIKLPEIFYNFLINEAIFEIYILEIVNYLNGLNKEGFDRAYEYFIEILECKKLDYSVCGYINEIFDWSATKKGVKFWSEIDKKWRKVLFDKLYNNEIIGFELNDFIDETV